MTINFKEILNLEDFNLLIQNNSNDFSQIANDLDFNSSKFEFSFTLDDFARSFGNTYGLNISNYSDLTDLANAQHGANWTVEEYASAYQLNVDAINSKPDGNFVTSIPWLIHTSNNPCPLEFISS